MANKRTIKIHVLVFFSIVLISIGLEMTTNIFNIDILHDYSYFHIIIIAFSVTCAVFIFYFHRLLINEKKQFNKLILKNRQLDRKIYATQVMLSISNSILNINNIEELTNAVLEKVINVLDKADKGSILIMDDSEHLRFVAVNGYNLDKLKDLRLKLDETFLYKGTNDIYSAHIIKDPIHFNSEKLKHEKYTVFEDAKALEFKSVVCAPIIIDGKVIGMINIDNFQSYDIFDEYDLKVVEFLANQIGIAIRNTKLLEKIIKLSKYDNLTNIYNRHCFGELFKNLYNRASRYKEHFSLCVVDMDKLKEINDTFGHQAGDLAIKHFVQAVKSNLRESDIFARYGGDEFIIILLNTSFEDSASKLESILKTLKDKKLNYNDNKIQVSFSYGIAAYPYDTESKDKLITIADNRMYKHKTRYKSKKRMDSSAC